MKKTFNFLITLLLAFFICLFCISLCLRSIVINTLSKEVVKNEISNKVVDEVKAVCGDVNYDVLEKIETNINNSPELTKITKKYFDNIVDSIVNDDEINIPDTKKELLSIINDNNSILEENGIYVTDDEKEKLISKLVDNNTIDKLYKNVSLSVKDNMTDNMIMMTNLYDKVTSFSFRWVVLSIIVILVLLLALIKKTYYRWTYNLAISLFISGVVILLVIPSVADGISYELTQKLLGKSADINLNLLTNIGYMCFGVCALFIIIYLIGNKISKYNDKKYDY